MMSAQVRDPETYAIIGAAMAVHAELGCGFLEAVYQQALHLEVKAIRELGPIERAQVLNYLKATGYHRALLINFGAESLQFERIVR